MANRTTGSEVKDYIVCGDHVTGNGDVKFDQRLYEAQTPREAVKQAKEDGLIRVTSSLRRS